MDLFQNADLTDDEIAATTGRSIGSVKRMRGRIEAGWVPKMAPPLNRVEMDFIAANPAMTAQAVADALGATYAAVTYARRRLAREQGADFGTGPYDKDPTAMGDRMVLAKTCLSCGLLLGGRHFAKAGKGRGLQAHCTECRALSRPASDHDRLERRVEAMASDPLIPDYASRRYYDYTETDLQVLGDESLTVAEQAARLGRTYGATAQARKDYQVAVARGERPEPGGLWRITLPAELVSA
jgi:hypothetical protein